MEAWLTPYQKRHSRLCYVSAPSGLSSIIHPPLALLTLAVSGYREMCTIMGLFRLEEADMVANSGKNVARYIPSPDWGRAWHTCVHSLHHLICQGAPLDWIQAHLRVLGQIMVRLFSFLFFLFLIIFVCFVSCCELILNLLTSFAGTNWP